jgi:hypothetical protein
MVDVMGVHEAARALGISPGAVRKRIARGQLEAMKVKGRWQVMLDTQLVENATPIMSEDEGGGQPGLTREQLELIRDEWLQPLLLQMRAQAEQIGRLEARSRMIEEERDRLRAEADELRAQLDANPTSAPASRSESLATLRNMASQLYSTDGAMVAGIALALGLWLSIGILAFAVLG